MDYRDQGGEKDVSWLQVFHTAAFDDRPFVDPGKVAPTTPPLARSPHSMGSSSLRDRRGRLWPPQRLLARRHALTGPRAALLSPSPALRRVLGDRAPARVGAAPITQYCAITITPPSAPDRHIVLGPCVAQSDSIRATLSTKDRSEQQPTRAPGTGWEDSRTGPGGEPSCHRLRCAKAGASTWR